MRIGVAIPGQKPLSPGQNGSQQNHARERVVIKMGTEGEQHPGILSGKDTQLESGGIAKAAALLVFMFGKRVPKPDHHRSDNGADNAPLAPRRRDDSDVGDGGEVGEGGSGGDGGSD